MVITSVVHSNGLGDFLHFSSIVQCCDIIILCAFIANLKGDPRDKSLRKLGISHYFSLETCLYHSGIAEGVTEAQTLALSLVNSGQVT